ncbi:MAG: hypothetical protein ACRDGJ_04640 [Candidatus Limnocylindria bacterium]
MWLMRTLGAAGAIILTALIGATIISAASAARSAPEAQGTTLAQETDAGGYCTLYLDTLAAELGVSTDALVPAAKTAAMTTIQAMVDAGDLPADIGERMIAKIEAAEGNGCALLGFRFHRGVRHAAHAEFRDGMFQAAADALNLTVDEVRERFRAGESLRDLANAQGVDYATVSGAVLDSATDDLNAAVEAGKITQERADAILERIDRWLQSGGQPGKHFRPAGPDGSDG